MGTEQITAGKGQLRQRIRELEATVAELRNDPLRRRVELLKEENAQLRADRNEQEQLIEQTARKTEEKLAWLEASLNELRKMVDHMKAVVEEARLRQARAVEKAKELMAIYGEEG